MRSFMQEHLANLMIVHTFTEEENTVIEAEAYADRLVDRILHRGKFAVISNLCTYGMMRVDICWGGGNSVWIPDYKRTDDLWDNGSYFAVDYQNRYAGL